MTVSGDGLRAAFALAWRAAPGWLIARLIITAVSATVPVAAAWLTKLVIDRLSPGATLPALLIPAALLAFAGLLMALIPHAQRYIEAETSRTISFFLRTDLFAALARQGGLARLEDPSFHDRLSMAALAAQSGPAQIVTQVLLVAQGVIVVAGFVIALSVLSPILTAIVGLAAIPALRAELAISRERTRVAWELSESGRRELFYGELLTDQTAAKEIRLFGLGAYFGDRQRRELTVINRRLRALDRKELTAQGLPAAAAAIIAGLGLVWAILSARSGTLSIGDVSMLIASVAGVQTGLSIVFTNLGQIHESLLFFGHYRAVAEAEPDLSVAAAPVPLPELKRGIEFRDVWFRYGPEQPWILRGATFTLAAGRATALVGLNGAGKSTIVKLLCRLYDPDKGAILWDGIDLRDFDLGALRARMGAVFQDFMRYDLTAADNIGTGDVTAIDDRSRIAAAAGAAGAEGLIGELPRGYDTMLTRLFSADEPGAGLTLSGGQWQRLAVARGMMRRGTDLLILDEPSSGLDAQAEHEIHQRLRRLREGRTSLLISHRLSAVREAGAIVVIADGVVAEFGTHEELLKKEQGTYAHLFRTQASGYA